MMGGIKSFIERLRTDVGTRCGCQVQSNEYDSSEYYVLRKLSTSGKGNFAYIRYIKKGKSRPDKCFEIQVRESYAIKAKVAHLADHHDKNGCHNEKARYWFVLEGHSQSYNKAVDALSKICQVR